LTDGRAVLVSGNVIWIAWPVVAALTVWCQVRRRARWPQMLAAVALVGYAWWICSVAFFPFPGAQTAAGLRSAGLPWVNLVPIRELVRHLPLLPARQIVRQFGGNVLLFVPFTFFGPIFWPRLRSWRWPLAVGLGGSLAIEVLQLALSGVAGFPYRQTDIDDVILNTAGAFLGFAVFLVARVAAARSRKPGASLQA